MEHSTEVFFFFKRIFLKCLNFLLYTIVHRTHCFFPSNIIFCINSVYFRQTKIFSDKFITQTLCLPCNNLPSHGIHPKASQLAIYTPISHLNSNKNRTYLSQYLSNSFTNTHYLFLKSFALSPKAEGCSLSRYLPTVSSC